METSFALKFFFQFRIKLITIIIAIVIIIIIFIVIIIVKAFSPVYHSIQRRSSGDAHRANEGIRFG